MRQTEYANYNQVQKAVVEALQQETSSAAGDNGHPIQMAGVNICQMAQSIVAEKKLVNSDIYSHPPKKLLEVIRNMGETWESPRVELKCQRLSKPMLQTTVIVSLCWRY